MDFDKYLRQVEEGINEGKVFAEYIDERARRMNIYPDEVVLACEILLNIYAKSSPDMYISVFTVYCNLEELLNRLLIIPANVDKMNEYMEWVKNLTPEKRDKVNNIVKKYLESKPDDSH